MKHSKHLLRAALLVTVVFIALFALRFIERPESFGETGHFRADNIAEQRSHKTVHGQEGACGECHEEAGTLEKGSHRRVACESCHAPVSTHISEGEYVGQMKIRKVAGLCLTCHQKLDGRPAAHPQIDPTEHLQEMDEEWNPEVCYHCHHPHSPEEGLS